FSARIFDISRIPAAPATFPAHESIPASNGLKKSSVVRSPGATSARNRSWSNASMDRESNVSSHSVLGRKRSLLDDIKVKAEEAPTTMASTTKVNVKPFSHQIRNEIYQTNGRRLLRKPEAATGAGGSAGGGEDEEKKSSPATLMTTAAAAATAATTT